MSEALLLGYFGAENFGDELILRAFLKSYGELLREKGIYPTITVKQTPSDEYRRELSQFAGVDVGFTRITPLLPYQLSAKRAKYLIAPGGGLLQNKTSLRSLVFYLAIINEFNRAGKKVLLLNQGIGPIYGVAWQKMTKNALSRITFFSARDKMSALFVADSLPPEKRFLCSDAAFSEKTLLKFDEPSESKYEFGFIVKGVVRSPILSSPEFPPKGDNVICAFQREEWENPRKVERLGRRFDRESLNIITPWEFLKRIKGCEVVMSERYHGLVMALLAGVPFVGIGTDPKITSFCQESGMPQYGGARLTTRDMKNLKEEAIRNFDQKRFSERVSDYSARHERQKELIRQLL